MINTKLLIDSLHRGLYIVCRRGLLIYRQGKDH